ncbi:UNVERIFIED_CONTAM: hypothetical protein GTU68_003025 [Idotea baltica]|nr:hypothetical protein [Idotea baltica]
MNHLEIVPSPSFISVIEELSSLGGAPPSIKSHSKGSSITLTTSDIRWCHGKIKERGLPHRIHQLLNDSQIVLPKYEPPPRSPELEERIQLLKAQQANREYRRMTKNLIVDQFEASNLKGLGTDLKEFNAQVREMNRQLVTGAQYLLSVIGTFFAVFIGLSYVLSEYGTRVLFSMFCAVSVGVAEIYFIIRQDINEEKKIEKKNS